MQKSEEESVAYALTTERHSTVGGRLGVSEGVEGWAPGAVGRTCVVGGEVFWGC